MQKVIIRLSKIVFIFELVWKEGITRSSLRETLHLVQFGFHFVCFSIPTVLGTRVEQKVKFLIKLSALSPTGAYPSFHSMKRLGFLLYPLDAMLTHRKVTPTISSSFLTICWYPFKLLGGEGQCESSTH